jgi:2-polyprenyl-6-methoxyphenol hydroxylase-like FAD-dependent oxidoreductase
MNGHVVVIAGGGPTGLMLAGELALASADVAIVERRASQELDSSRSGGLQAPAGYPVGGGRAQVDAGRCDRDR